MSKDLEGMTPAELKAQADAILAAADAKQAELIEEEAPAKPKRTARKKAADAAQEPARVMTDEEAK